MKDLSREESLEQDIEILEQTIAILEAEVNEAREEKSKQEIARSERKEKIEQEIARLEQLISRKDDAFDKEQWKRLKRTFFVLCGVIYFILLYLASENGIYISDIIKGVIKAISDMDIESIFYLLVSLTLGVAVAAGLIMFVSFGVTFYIMNGALKRAETIAKLKGELNAIKYSKFNKE